MPQSTFCCCCGCLEASTIGTNGKSSHVYPCHTFATLGEQYLHALKPAHSLCKGRSAESVWVQCPSEEEVTFSRAVVVHCSSTPLSAPKLPGVEPLLGVLVSVVDEVASNFVFGPYGTAGRPKGVMDISIMHSLLSARPSGSACNNRWLRQWQNAGWDVDSLLDFANTIRPLQYRDDLDDEYIDGLTKEDLLKCIAELYSKQVFTMVKQCDVEAFIEIVHHHFSKPDAVLLPKSGDEYKVLIHASPPTSPYSSRL